MISRALCIRDLDGEHLANLQRLFDPPEGHDAPPGDFGPLSAVLQRGTAMPAQPASESSREPVRRRRTTQSAIVVRPPALALTRGGEVLRVVLFGGGTLPARRLRSMAVDDLRAFRLEFGLPFVVAADVGALPKLWAALQRGVNFDDDYVAQKLAMVDALRRALADGDLVVDPDPLPRAPVPPYHTLQQAFEYMLPSDRCLAFYVADHHRVWTAVIARQRGGDIDLIAGHRAVADDTRLISLSRDAPQIVAAIASRIAPVHAAVFVNLTTWRLFVAGDRSALARAAAAREAVINPCPSWLLAFVGMGAVSDAAARSARLAGRLLARAGLGSAEKMAASLGNPLDAFGLDPWEWISWAHTWSSRLRSVR